MAQAVNFALPKGKKYFKMLAIYEILNSPTKGDYLLTSFKMNHAIVAHQDVEVNAFA